MNEVKNNVIKALEKENNIHSQCYSTTSSLGAPESLHVEYFLSNQNCVKIKNNIIACLSNSN